MKIILFEDTRVTDLYPITIGRPAMAITCGATRLIDQIVALDRPVQVAVRPHLTALVEADFPHVAVDGAKSDGGFDADPQPLLYVNARLVPSLHVRKELASLVQAAQPGIVRTGESVAVALLPKGAQPVASPSATGNWLPYSEPGEEGCQHPGCSETAGKLDPCWNEHMKEYSLPSLNIELPLLDYPHNVLHHHLATLSDHLSERINSDDYREIADGVFAADGTTLAEYIVFETTEGPIVIDRGASIGPFTYLKGPIYIGPFARVLEHASVKEHVAIGHTTKIGGEVEASVVEPYTNKQHHGFIGHSYLGSWINLGAGTCNSDLKNTYGTVNMDYGGRRVVTDMQFVGAIIGDYAKSAINTGLFTGKTVGVCSMAYGFVTTNVPSFVNYARHFGQITATPVEVMVAAQSRMFARRNIEQRPCDIQLIHDMYELTRHERELGSVPLEPLSL